jgi:hypothetical protein
MPKATIEKIMLEHSNHFTKPTGCVTHFKSHFSTKFADCLPAYLKGTSKENGKKDTGDDEDEYDEEDVSFIHWSMMP